MRHFLLWPVLVFGITRCYAQQNEKVHEKYEKLENIWRRKMNWATVDSFFDKHKTHYISMDFDTSFLTTDQAIVDKAAGSYSNVFDCYVLEGKHKDKDSVNVAYYTKQNLINPFDEWRTDLYRLDTGKKDFDWQVSSLLNLCPFTNDFFTAGNELYISLSTPGYFTGTTKALYIGISHDISGILIKHMLRGMPKPKKIIYAWQDPNMKIFSIVQNLNKQAMRSIKREF
jgi:hypothetical protein